MIAVIVPAAGLGKRVGGKTPKQFLTLAGKPLLIWTLEAVQRVPEVDLIAVSVLPPYKALLHKWVEEYALKKVRIIVPGGDTRQESVKNALWALPEETEIVLVHDAARPLVSVEVIQRVIEISRRHGAALAACPARDTIKEIENGKVIRTLPRERIYLAQTPQGASFPLLKKAFIQAEKDGFVGTDEASLLENLGVKIFVVSSPFTNFKVTTAEDLTLAEALLNQRP